MNFGNPFGSIGQKGFGLETIIVKSTDVVDINNTVHPDIANLLEVNNVQMRFGELTSMLASVENSSFEDPFEVDDTIRLLRLGVVNQNGVYVDNSIPRLISGSEIAPISIPKYTEGIIPQIGNERGLEILTYSPIPIDFDEWYFINASFDPTVTQSDNQVNLFNEEYWNNQMFPTNLEFTDFSGLGNQCIVEFISKSDLIRARGFRDE